LILRPGFGARLGGDPPSPWEEQYGYSRVVRAGSLVFMGGTTSVASDGSVAGASAYEQTVVILRRVAHELSRVGASLSDVVQTRAFVTDIAAFADEVGRAHGEAFGAVRPVMSMVEVARLIDERMLVEIEVVAVCGGDRSATAGGAAEAPVESGAAGAFPDDP
jgi:enamine deaminase RidA (YjgF/YER057c/UK114 family)